MNEAGLGRFPSTNQQRLANYPLSQIHSERTFRSWLVPGAPSDQGGWPHCVAHAGNHLLVSHPNPLIQLSVLDLYNWCQKNDVWPGEDYEGTSVDAVLQAFRKLNFIKEYRWTKDVNILMSHVLESGPVILGTDWWEHMANPANNVMTIGGDNFGGHAWIIPSTNKKTRMATCLNSHGNWERSGRAYISWDTIQTLLDRNGEAALVTKWQ